MLSPFGCYREASCLVARVLDVFKWYRGGIMSVCRSSMHCKPTIESCFKSDSRKGQVREIHLYRVRFKPWILLQGEWHREALHWFTLYVEAASWVKKSGSSSQEILWHWWALCGEPRTGRATGSALQFFLRYFLWKPCFLWYRLSQRV